MSISIAATTITFNDATTQSTAAVNGIGYSQTWQDLTSSRAIGTSYTNSTGKPIMVAVNTSSGAQTTLTIDSVVVGRYSQNTGGLGSQLIAIVPNGSSYIATGGTISNWAELR